MRHYEVGSGARDYGDPVECRLRHVTRATDAELARFKVQQGRSVAAGEGAAALQRAGGGRSIDLSPDGVIWHGMMAQDSV